jgi:hypothetical protein
MRKPDYFEIHFAERSLEQAKFAFNKFMEVAERAMNSFEGQSEVAQARAKEAGKRIMNFAEQNVANAFDYAQKLVRTKNLQTLITWRGDFISAQMGVFREQATTVHDIATRVAAE